MWNGWKRLVTHAARYRATISIEWAWGNKLHDIKKTKKLIGQYGLKSFKVSGCRFGLASIVSKTRGQPLCKAWRIWTNNPSLSAGLDGRHVICQGGHPSTPVSGADTAHSGTYPDGFAKFVNKVITTPLDELQLMATNNSWPVVGKCPP